jgi:hypothetical protein
MDPDEKKGLSNTRYLRAKECLEAAGLLPNGK